MNLKKDLEQLKHALDGASKYLRKIDEVINPKKALIDYTASQQIYFQKAVAQALERVKQDLAQLKDAPKQFLSAYTKIETTSDVAQMRELAAELILLSEDITLPKGVETFITIPKALPAEIKDDIVLDLKEMDKCYQNQCYRSCIILCGRVLETALHRKYFEATGNDALEKSPGIGLGNLIAKLAEKNVPLDPGLTNQIHLLNQVRVFSVHKKKEAFYPTQQQTQAMILYTLDILEKLFVKQ